MYFTIIVEEGDGEHADGDEHADDEMEMDGDMQMDGEEHD